MKNINKHLVVSLLIVISISLFSQEINLVGSYRDVPIPEKIQGPVGNQLPSGTYSVGVNGNFPTLDSAFNKLSIDGIAGEIQFELVDELYSIPENSSGFLLHGPIQGAGPDSRVIIKPAINKNVTIEGNGEAVLYFINTSYVTIDGISLTGQSTLTINSFQNTVYQWNDGVIFLNNSKHNIVRNVTIECEDYTRLSGGIVFLHQSGNFTSDSNLIQNNFIKKAAVGINVASLFYKATGNIIRGNAIGSGSDSLISLGINVVLGQYTTVENNIIQNLRFNSQLPFCSGIVSSGGTGDIIKNNIVHNVNVTYGNYSSSGIFLNGTTNCTGIINSVYNNMIYDIRSSSNDTSAKVSGIELRNQSYAKIYFNSVDISGTDEDQNSSAALYIGINCSNNFVKNNILINARDESLNNAFAIFDYQSTNLSSDYNNLYVGRNENSILVRRHGVDYKSLSDWQLIGMDTHSFNEMPHFEGPDLHIDRRLEICIEMSGISIPGINTDIDGEQRNTLTPDIGADEFDCIVSEVNETGIVEEFKLEQNYPNPFNPSTTIKFTIPSVIASGAKQSQFVSLKVYDILGNEIATLVNEEKSAGSYEVKFNANGLSSGIYFYKLQTGNFIETRKMNLLK